MSGTMAQEVAQRRDEKAKDPTSGWKTSDVMIACTYYGDGVSPNDHGRTSIEVLTMTILNVSPELQDEKP